MNDSWDWLAIGRAYGSVLPRHCRSIPCFPTEQRVQDVLSTWARHDHQKARGGGGLASWSSSPRSSSSTLSRTSKTANQRPCSDSFLRADWTLWQDQLTNLRLVWDPRWPVHRFYSGYFSFIPGQWEEVETCHPSLYTVYGFWFILTWSHELYIFWQLQKTQLAKVLTTSSILSDAVINFCPIHRLV